MVLYTCLFSSVIYHSNLAFFPPMWYKGVPQKDGGNEKSSSVLIDVSKDLNILSTSSR